MKTLMTKAVNIRSIADATFTPSTEGLTAVVGPNGAGKSTLTVAVPLLAGWGVTPPGVSKLADVIRDGETTASAEWEFEQGGKVYHVTRRFTINKNGNTTSRGEVTIDGDKSATKGMKVSDISGFISKVTGLDHKAFLNTSLIAQGQVADLVSANPADVRNTLMDIMGVTDARRAADRLNKKVRDHKVPDAPDSETMESLEEGQRNAESEVKTAEAENASATAVLTEKRGAVDTAERALNDLVRKRDEANQARRAIEDRATAARAQQEGYQNRIASTRETLTQTVANIEGLELDASNLDALIEQVDSQRVSLESALANRNEVAAKVDPTLDGQISAVEADETRLQGEVESAKQSHQTALSAVGDAERAVESAQANENTLRERIEATTAEVEQVRSKMDGPQTEVRRAYDLAETLKSSLQALQGSGECPTCGTHVGNAEELHNKIEDQLASAQEQARHWEEQVKSIGDEVQAAIGRKSSTEAEYNAARAATTQSHGEVNRAKDAATAAERGIDSAEKVLGECRAYLSNLREKKVESDKAQSVLATLGDDPTENLNQVRARANELNQVFRLRESIAADEASLAGVHLPTQEEYDALPVAPEESSITDADTTLRTARDELNAASSEAGRAGSALTNANNNLANASRLLHEASEKVRVKREAEEKIAELAAAAKLLTQFTVSYTQEKVTAITHAVNSLLPLSGSEFSEFRLTEDFAPVVTFNGNERPTSDLSGGEQSVLGLLFRIGISAAVTGGVLQSTLVADEPLAALDAEARQRVTTMLAKLPVPVVLISHTPEAEEAAEVTAYIRRARYGTTEVEMVTA